MQHLYEPNYEPNLPTVFFYVHHHGAGHITRAELLINKLQNSYNVVVLYGDLKVKMALNKVCKRGVFEKLPSKWVGRSSVQRNYNAAFEGIEYSEAPLERSITFNLLAQQYKPVLFISDVSAELTIMARSIGIPVLMQRHSGDISGDPTQVFAYECATKLYAPYPKQLETPHYGYFNKTHYLGFISKYTGSESASKTGFGNHITLLITDAQRAALIARVLTNYTDHVEVIGCHGEPIKGVTYKGMVANINQAITASVVVTSGGNNAVSQLLALGKKLIVIPENRPYQEQDEKARMLAKNNLAVHLPFSAFLQQNNALIEAALIDARKTQMSKTQIISDTDQFISEFIALVEEVAIEP